MQRERETNRKWPVGRGPSRFLIRWLGKKKGRLASASGIVRVCKGGPGFFSPDKKRKKKIQARGGGEKPWSQSSRGKKDMAARKLEKEGKEKKRKKKGKRKKKKEERKGEEKKEEKRGLINLGRKKKDIVKGFLGSFFAEAEKKGSPQILRVKTGSFNVKWPDSFRGCIPGRKTPPDKLKKNTRERGGPSRGWKNALRGRAVKHMKNQKKEEKKIASPWVPQFPLEGGSPENMSCTKKKGA